MSSDWLRSYHSAPDAKTVVVFFPHAGGAASFYFPFSAALSPQVGALCVQYPGRQDRRAEPPASSIAELAEALARELKPWEASSLVFFGHSMGALVAYETALLLDHAGSGQPRLLVASGRRAPSRYRDDLAGFSGDEHFIRELVTLGGTAQVLLDDPEFLQAALPVMRADYLAVGTYRHVPGEQLACPVRVLYGDRDDRVSDDEASSWARHTSAGFSRRTFPGGHFYMRSHVDAVAEDIRRHSSPRAEGI
jgi:surfactin synthase thioesterase subunit